MGKPPDQKTPDSPQDNVIDLFTGEPVGSGNSRQLVRVSPELDGLEMLYSNQLNPGKLFAMRILCWGLRRNGEVVGLIPWMEKVLPCPDVTDPLGGRFEGYYDPGIDEVFFEAPIHKVVELETSAEYYGYESENPEDVIQEIPDSIGTHAVFSTPDTGHLMLMEIISWQLSCDGTLNGMVVDREKCTQTPVLPGDECLYSANKRESFRYFFQHHIANKIKARDPEALAALAMLASKPMADKDSDNKNGMAPAEPSGDPA